MTSFEIGKPLPRAEDAYVEDEKWSGWILAPPGHAADWNRVFGPVTADDIWRAIVDVVEVAPIVNIRISQHGISCGVQMSLTLNNRTVSARTAWH